MFYGFLVVATSLRPFSFPLPSPTVYSFILIQSRVFSHMATVFLYDI